MSNFASYHHNHTLSFASVSQIMSLGKLALIIGPGFIGWNVLDLLVQEGYHVSALVRRKQHADEIAKCGASPILGDLNDTALITQKTSVSDIVFHSAGADHRASIEAVLKGMSERAQQGRTTIYIHTSGAKVLSDNALGAFKSERLYQDDRREDVDWVSDDAPHRPVDLTILATQKKLGNAAKIAIMFPPEIYGYYSKHDRLSIMMPKIA
jgi:nucleoside-diphosphate-sugar epimerase